MSVSLSAKCLQDYCYSGQCDYEGCLDDLINTMHEHELGAFCKAGDNGCQVIKLNGYTLRGSNS